MMLYPSVNGLREKVDSSYTLCILAAKRARDIIDGNPVLTDVEAERPVSLATNEIAEDRITYRRIEMPETVTMRTSIVTESELDAYPEDETAENEEGDEEGDETEPEENEDDDEEPVDDEAPVDEAE